MRTKQKRLLNLFSSSGGRPLVRSYCQWNSYDFNDLALDFNERDSVTEDILWDRFDQYKGQHFDILLVNIWNYNYYQGNREFVLNEAFEAFKITYDEIRLFFYNSFVEDLYEEGIRRPFLEKDYNMLYSDIYDKMIKRTNVVLADNDYEIGHIKELGFTDVRLINTSEQFMKFYFTDKITKIPKTRKIIWLNNKYRLFNYKDVITLCEELPDYTIVDSEPETIKLFDKKIKNYAKELHVKKPKNLVFKDSTSFDEYKKCLEYCKGGYAFCLHPEAFGVKFYDYLPYGIKPLCSGFTVSNDDVKKDVHMIMFDGFPIMHNFIKAIKNIKE